MATARQLEKAGRWIAFEANGALVWTYEGNIPRLGHADWGDTKSSKHVLPDKAAALVDRLARLRLDDGWTETEVGGAPAAAPAKRVAKRAAASTQSPNDVAKPVKPPSASAIADIRETVMAKARERASKNKLVAWKRIEPLVRPAVAIELSQFNAAAPIGASRVGGVPDLPANAKWPRTTRPLEFVAQLRLEELEPFEANGVLPRTGLLLLFADLAPASPKYLEDGAAVLVTRLVDLARRAAPDGVSALAESAVAYAATISLPPADGVFIAGAKLSSDERATYNDRVLVPALKDVAHQALGYPTLTEVETVDADEHCVLQLASDKKRKLAFGDAQTLRFFMRKGKGGMVRVTALDI